MAGLEQFRELPDAVLQERWQNVCMRVQNAAQTSGRTMADVTLVAVSKFHAAEAVACVAACGQKDFGENYVQEALGKQEALAGHPACQGLRWHCIGHVQSRKAALVAGHFVLVHSVDSFKLAQGMEKALAAREECQPVLIQVNVGSEPQKSGVDEANLVPLAEQLMTLPHLAVQGLMCIPPMFDDGPRARPYFARLRELRDSLRPRLGLPLPHLSMGMSGDFVEAVAEGASLVRIGTDIFGQRPPQ
ncbi:MAG: YggS family pyridoxal phosphate-dependent enzyme [Desulfovibrionaceae bacterium]